MQRAHFVQVWTVFASIADGDFHFTGPWELQISKTVETLRQNSFQFVVTDLQRIELDQQGAIRRMKIENRRNGFHLEQPQEFSDMFMRLEADLMAEVNEQGLIAGAFELRAFRQERRHAAKV